MRSDPDTASASYPDPGPGASVAVPGGTAGSARHAWPGPAMVSARLPPVSTQRLPDGPNPDAVTPPTPTGADTVQRPPCDQAASRSVPAASSAVSPPGTAASPSTCT